MSHEYDSLAPNQYPSYLQRVRYLQERSIQMQISAKYSIVRPDRPEHYRCYRFLLHNRAPGESFRLSKSARLREWDRSAHNGSVDNRWLYI